MDASKSMPLWLKTIILDFRNEAETLGSTRLLEHAIRKSIWYTCRKLIVHEKGVPGQACRLLEQYMVHYLNKYKNLAVTNRAMFHMRLKIDFPLAEVACIYLAASMCDMETMVQPEILRTFVKGFGHVHCSVMDIKCALNHVYDTLGRLPLWTGVEAARLLAEEIGIPTELAQKGVASMMNFVEFYKDMIDHEVYLILHKTTPPAFYATVDSLSLVGGVVVASDRYYRLKLPDPAGRVAALLRLHATYLQAVSEVILDCIKIVVKKMRKPL